MQKFSATADLAAEGSDQLCQGIERLRIMALAERENRLFAHPGVLAGLSELHQPSVGTLSCSKTIGDFGDEVFVHLIGLAGEAWPAA